MIVIPNRKNRLNANELDNAPISTFGQHLYVELALAEVVLLYSSDSRLIHFQVKNGIFRPQGRLSHLFPVSLSLIKLLWTKGGEVMEGGSKKW